MAVAATDTHRTLDTVWRLESARIIAGLARIVRDVGVAEELAQDAVLAALEQWPREGIPVRPGAWLSAAAKHRALDRLRRTRMLDRKHEEIARELEARQESGREELEAVLDDDIGDDVLRLIFTACHPVLPREGRVALTLRLLGGLGTPEIARAFLVPEATVAQRIVRAKRTLTAARVPFELPRGADRAARLASVLEVLYLIFNEGYTATAGDDWLRPSLCEEALRLGRLLVQLAPAEAEAHGLLALMMLQASRSPARLSASGEPILLLEQDRTLWERTRIRDGLAALERAESLSSARGPYTLQAALAACHARAPEAAETNWPRIVELYTELLKIDPSPIVELNRAVAVGMAFGPTAALPLVDALLAEPSLAGYHLLPSVRGDLLAKLGHLDAARAELERAASLTKNTRERRLLLDRAEKW